jgi:hypothetical protein
MAKHSVKKYKSKVKTKRNRNKKNKRSIKKNRHTRKGGINFGIKDKIKKTFNKGKVAISDARGTSDLVSFLNGIPAYNKQVLMSKFLTLSLDDSPEKLDELETQKQRYINDTLPDVEPKILEKHPLQLIIDKYSLSREKIEKEKEKAFKTDDEKKPNPIVLLSNNPKKSNNINYSEQKYAEYIQEKGLADIKYQYVSHNAIGDLSKFVASDNEETIKNAIKNNSTEGVEDRDDVNVSNRPPILRSYYVPVKSDKYSNMFKRENIDTKDEEEGEENNTEKNDEKVTEETEETEETEKTEKTEKTENNEEK